MAPQRGPWQCCGHVRSELSTRNRAAGRPASTTLEKGRTIDSGAVAFRAQPPLLGIKAAPGENDGGIKHILERVPTP